MFHGDFWLVPGDASSFFSSRGASLPSLGRPKVGKSHGLKDHVHFDVWISGWWLTYPSETWWKVIKFMFQTTNQIWFKPTFRQTLSCFYRRWSGTNFDPFPLHSGYAPNHVGQGKYRPRTTYILSNFTSRGSWNANILAPARTKSA
jgi:hypothetical protein